MWRGWNGREVGEVAIKVESRGTCSMVMPIYEIRWKWMKGR
jgi:hypothetical protein